MQNSAVDPANLLAEELDAARGLLQLLKREQDCLMQANVNELQQLTLEKTELVTKMANLGQSRLTALSKCGLEAREESMETWIRSYPQTHPVQHAWQELLDLAKNAKELNRVNGLLIGQHMARNQTMLNTLRGNTQAGTMYGPDGQANSPAASRKFVVG